MDALLIFPHQLFVHPRKNTVHFFLEDRHFFMRQLPMHKQKIIYHRATMRSRYQAFDGEKHYVSYPFERDDFFKELKTYDRILAYDPIDHTLKALYDDVVDTWLRSPNFIYDMPSINAFFHRKTRYFMHDFYVKTRQSMHILMDNGNPIGGQYSFDKENRKKLPKSVKIPPSLTFSDHESLKEARQFCETHFHDAPGSLTACNYPITREDAIKQLDYFIAHKLPNFGPYQDALSARDPYLFHAVISAPLNVGLLDPKTVVEAIEQADAPLASKEGFIRQVIGWREFIRAVYVREGNTMITQNKLNHTRKLSRAWYTASTGIDFVDTILKKIIDHAYAHHIERLMVLGNLMLLLNIHPKEVTKFFSRMFIDAYDWVMIPNVYGMSQFAAGPLMSTKPYMSGSNYLKKMGVKDGPWAEYWDACFYLFLNDHRNIIEKNPRLRMLLGHLDKKDKQTLTHYASLKAEWVQRLTD